jgi:hypothetical protein
MRQLAMQDRRRIDRYFTIDSNFLTETVIHQEALKNKFIKAWQDPTTECDEDHSHDMRFLRQKARGNIKFGSWKTNLKL